MHFRNFKVAALAVIASTSAAKAISIDVGENGLTYSPSNSKAAAGESVEFHFYAQHSVVAADFSKPCNPASSGGFFSGIKNTASLPVSPLSLGIFSIVINNTDPIFFYCVVDGHCQAGMVGVINQGTDTLDAFKAAAEKTDNSVRPGAPFGGFNGPAPNSSGSASSTAGSKTESPTSTASTSGTQTQHPTSSSPSAAATSGAAAHLNGPVAAVGGLAIAVAALVRL
ncbi:hypothetical protein TOPH_04606 [Tolypocladium ophioglossoides CBS 100239]|uniref:Extracellular serine-rich protein n=1 Tax=Tolypocladium ophioglossoides (strain CBS 100239) TaxID=1163406 RepID=A0A0L0N9K4_TOLOC|nr:hypothetical protein TOPH_04606 [Tolypocladium ophioglossoides CBS 100239]